MSDRTILQFMINSSKNTHNDTDIKIKDSIYTSNEQDKANNNKIITNLKPIIDCDIALKNTASIDTNALKIVQRIVVG